MDVSKFYAGIGSRATPNDILKEMEEMAQYLEKQGYILRSGGAPGADTAFEAGAINKEIYLPWKGFNNHPGGIYPPTEEAFNIASFYHPKWPFLTQGAQKLHARNVHQILGRDCNTPSAFVLCWTPGGSEAPDDKRGGTGQAIRVANGYKICVVNMFDRLWETELWKVLKHTQF